MFSAFTRRGRFESRTNRRAKKQRMHIRPHRLSLESLESRQMLSGTPVDLQFHVLNDATANVSYRYDADGTSLGNSALATANATPRGAASMIGIDKTWVIDANRNVYVYNASGGLLGSWSAGSMPNNATPEGIATNGTDIWIVDSRSDQVFRYAGAASRLAGSQAADTSFGLGFGANPKDIVTDGVFLWIVDDGKKWDRVLRYHVTAGYWGSWTIDPANKTPTGIALDPANVGDIWISDSGTDRVYKYAAATSRIDGSQNASGSFALSSGNTNPQGLVVPGRLWAEAPYEVEWVRQFGSPGDDWGRGVVGDGAGNLYLSGTLVPSTDTGYLAKYDSDGNQVWLHLKSPIAGVQYGGVRVEVDGAGNVFQVVNVTSGSAASNLESYDADGNLRWSTPLPIGESMFDVAVDASGSAYASSYEGNNVHIRKYDGADRRPRPEHRRQHGRRHEHLRHRRRRTGQSLRDGVHRWVSARSQRRLLRRPRHEIHGVAGPFVESAIRVA